MSHTNTANLPFARNWWQHLRTAGVRNFALLATDDDAAAALEHALPGRGIRCPPDIFTAEADGPVSYRSAGWTRLMFAVPLMVRWVLNLGINVLWMDTDVVAVANPFPHVRALMAEQPPPQVPLLLASVDGRVPDDNLRECGRTYTSDRRRWGRSAGGGKLCGGLFYLQHGVSATAFLQDWERRLRAPGAGAKNQPHYNEAISAAATSLSVRTLPCDLFPNGYRYGRAQWRSAQRRKPVLVHANWLKGAATKQQHLQAWGLWLGANATQ